MKELQTLKESDRIENLDEDGSHRIDYIVISIVDDIFKGLYEPDEFYPWMGSVEGTEGVYFGITVDIDDQLKNYALVHTSSEASIQMLMDLFPRAFPSHHIPGGQAHDS